ncbi:MAG: GtrA family protein [Patescibacteria group bacterium]
MSKLNGHIKQFLIFCTGGIVNFALNTGGTYLLTNYLHLYYLYSFAIIQIIIIIYGFLYNNYLTFRQKKTSPWVAFKFIAFLHLFALINILFVRFFTDSIGLPYLISIIVTITFTIIGRFILYKKFVFIEDHSFLRHFFTRHYPVIILGAFLFIATLFIFGLIPGLYLNDLSAHYLMAANTDCLLNQGIFHGGYCLNYGYPYGHPFLMGLPFIYTSTFIAKIFFINSYLANSITGIIFILAAFIGTIVLLIKLKVNRYLAVVFGFIWLANPIVFGQSSYHYLMYGFACLPAYILIDLMIIGRLKGASINYCSAIWLIILILVRGLALFMDGYSFIISAFATGIILITKIIWQKYSPTVILKILFSFIFANLLAVLAYKLYSGTISGYGVMPLDFFRGQGIDWATFFVPSDNYWWASLVDIGYQWSDSATAYSFWGDGGNVFYSYLGFSLIVLLIVFLISRISKNITTKALLTAGLIALIISWGPAIKIHATRLAAAHASLTFDDYLMPAAETTFNLPYAGLYVAIPGLNNMRAIYRWLLLFKLCLIIAAALYLTHLFRQRSARPIAYLILAIIIIESLPNLSLLHQKYISNLDQLQLFNQDVIADLKKNISPGQRVYFVSTDNDFLANYIAAQLNIRSYNTGFDKNQTIAQAHWPSAIANIQPGEQLADSIYEALSTHQVDQIIYPYFNLRWDAYAWPPDAVAVQNTQQKTLLLSSDPRLLVDSHPYYTVVTINPDS